MFTNISVAISDKNADIFEVERVEGRGACVFISSAKSTTLKAYHSQENTSAIIKEYWCENEN